MAEAVCATPFCGNPSGFATVAPWETGVVGLAAGGGVVAVATAGAAEPLAFAAVTSPGLLADAFVVAAPGGNPNGLETVATGAGG